MQGRKRRECAKASGHGERACCAPAVSLRSKGARRSASIRWGRAGTEEGARIVMDRMLPAGAVVEGLTALVLVVALLVVAPGRERELRVLSHWLAGALVFETTARLLPVWMDGGSDTVMFMHGALHGLAPVLVLMGVYGTRANQSQSGLPLVLGVLVLGWLGVSTAAGLAPLWTDVPLLVGRGLVFALVADMAWRRRRAPFAAVAGLAVLLALVSGLAAAANSLAPPLLVLVGPGNWLLLVGLAVATLAGAAGARSPAGGPDEPPGQDPEARHLGDAGAILAALDVAIIRVSGDARVAWVNAGARQLFHAGSEAELVGLPWSRLVPEGGAEGAALTVAPGMAARGSFAEFRGAPGPVAMLARTLDGVDMSLEGTRLSGPDPSGGVTLKLLDRSQIEHLSVMARLSIEMDDLILSGAATRALSRLVCQRVREMEGATLVWIALPESSDGLVLQAIEGQGGTALAEGIGKPLPADIQVRLAGVLDHGRRTPRSGTMADPGGVPVAFPPTARDAAGGPDGDGEGDAAPGFAALLGGSGMAVAFSFFGPRDRFGVLVAHGAGMGLDRSARMRLDVVSRRLSNMARLCHENSFLRLQSAAMSVAANAIFITEQDGRIAWVNEAFTSLSGFSGEEVCGKTPHILFSGHQNTDTYNDMWGTIRRGDVWRGELVERRKDGTLYTVQQTVTPMRGPDDDSVYYVAVHEDISARKRAEERIRYLSNYDMLTRLPNRVLFRDRLHQAVSLARRVNGSVAVLFMDLTEFSRVNDTLGHDIGDQILMTVGSRINAAAAAEVDTVARMGGDEFAIIQSGAHGADAAASLAVRLARIVETPVEMAGNTVSLRVTIGIALYPEDGTDPDNLIKAADLAMHRVDRSQGEAYRFFSNEINDEAQIRLDLEVDLRRALERGELLNYYQPQYDMAGRLVGMEALVRWQHPTRGLVPPGQFITVAEESGLIVPLGEGVVQRALADLAAWKAEGLPMVPVAVNFSAVQLRDSALVTRLLEALEHHGLPINALDLELTESVLMSEHAGAVGFLTRLADAGFRIAIDDFGTGYSSLSYLKRFPVHKLKIDQSFVCHINEDRNDTILVSAIINLGHSLGMMVIAEGVETDDQLAHLRHVGVDVVQGYLLGRPMPEQDMRGLMRAPPLDFSSVEYVPDPA